MAGLPKKDFDQYIDAIGDGIAVHSKAFVSEPKLMEMDRKFIINIAPTGAIISSEHNPNVPGEPEAIAEQTIEAAKAGAAEFHGHVRIANVRTHIVDEYWRCYDAVAKEAPDLIYSFPAVADPLIMDRGQNKPVVEPLLKRDGLKYCECALLSPVTYNVGQAFFPMTEAAAIDQVEWLQSVGVKPELQVRNVDHMNRFQRFFINSGVLKKPYMLNVCAGTHDAAPSGPNPDGFLYEIMLWQRFPKKDTVIGICAGQRNWLPCTILAIMLGADACRIGMEEPIYMYPHKDELIKRNVDVVKKVVNITRELGREIATPDEARVILGLKPRTWALDKKPITLGVFKG
jgi:3-keto-5-aminohexanoate cleavage enzyme